MTITRAQVERILISRCGLLLIAAGLDGVINNGTNGDLNDPIGSALRASGLSVADISFVADSDLSSVTDDLVDQVLDIAEHRALLNIEGNLDQVDITIGPRSESRNQLAAQVRVKIDRLEARISRLYGVGLGTLNAGVIGLDFAEAEAGE